MTDALIDAERRNKHMADALLGMVEWEPHSVVLMLTHLVQLTAIYPAFREWDWVDELGKAYVRAQVLGKLEGEPPSFQRRGIVHRLLWLLLPFEKPEFAAESAAVALDVAARIAVYCEIPPACFIEPFAAMQSKHTQMCEQLQSKEPA